MNSVTIVSVDRLDLTVEPKTWDFADAHRAEIDAFFAQQRTQKPTLWNGRVLLMHRYAVVDDVMRGAFLETDYASLAAWQHWGRPAVEIYDCFGTAAMMAADGAFLVGVMAPHTFNAGYIYFPCGTPDPRDVADGKLDFDFSVRRELQEETGLDAADFAAELGWTIAIDGTQIAAIKVLRSNLAAEALRGRILDNMSREKQPELADIRIIRGTADFDPMMHRFVQAFLAQRLSDAQSGA